MPNPDASSEPQFQVVYCRDVAEARQLLGLEPPSCLTAETWPDWLDDPVRRCLIAIARDVLARRCDLCGAKIRGGYCRCT